VGEQGLPASVLPEGQPTDDERAMACLGHFLQFGTGFIGPLVLFLVKRDSRFVAFHALQALLLQLLYMVLMGVVMFGFFASIFASIPMSTGKPAGPPPFFFFFFPFFWLLMMGAWVLTMVLAIVYGVKAIRGQWAGYPVIGSWARRMLGLPQAAN